MATPTAVPDESAAKAPSRAPLLATAVLMLAVGGWLGWAMVGPALGPRSAQAEAEGGGGGHGAEAGRGPLIFKLDGVIANPAGSRGAHHAIVTVAFQVKSAADEALLRAAEVSLRDAAGSLLERKTLTELTGPGIRDQLRAEFAALADPLLHDGKVVVFLPQYIIQ